MEWIMIVKSLPTSLCQREELVIGFAKEGEMTRTKTRRSIIQNDYSPLIPPLLRGT